MSKHKHKNKNKLKNKIRKIRVLALIDSPAAATGFGTVARGILISLAKTKKFDIDVIGINDRGGWKDPTQYPLRIYPARIAVNTEGDYYGRPRLIAALLGKDPDLKPPWDIVFTLNDPFILEQPVPVFNKGTFTIIKEIQKKFKEKLPPHWWFKIISYWPVDSPIKGNWIEDAIALADYPIAYTEYGRKEIERTDKLLDQPTEVNKKLRVIYHGVDLKKFYPLPNSTIKQFRERYFEGKLKDETFLVVAVARNQLRKDLPRTMYIFKEFQKRRPDSFLYLHCQETDAWGSLREYARNWDLELGKDWAVPASFSANIGFPIEFMNLLYNAADCVLSTTLGEGFGFYNLESFATKTIVLAPNNTVHPELFNYDSQEDISDLDKMYTKLRGIPIKCGSTTSEWATYGAQDFERVRPLTNVDDAVKKLIWVYDNPDKVKEIEERAFGWVKNYDWSIIAKQWDNLFMEVFDELEHERTKTKNTSNK